MSRKNKLLYYPVLETEKSVRTPIIDFVYQLINLRADFGITQADLSEISGMKQQTISRIENIYDGVTVRTLSRLAMALGGSIEVKLKLPNKKVLKEKINGSKRPSES